MGDDDAVIVLQDHLFDGIQGPGPGKGNHGSAQQLLVHLMSVVEASYPVALEAFVAHTPTHEAPHVFVELVDPSIPGFLFQGIDTESDFVLVLEY